MSGYAKQRAGEKISALTRQSLDLVTLWREVTEALRPAIPYYVAPCWYTLDPASLLVTSHFNDDMPELPPEWLAQEYYEQDVNQLADVARSARGISTLHEATDGNPASSPRWHQNMELGADQELIACLRTKSGKVWGALGLYREQGQPLFDDEDLAFVRELSPVLAAGARSSLLLGEATDPEGSDAPGLIVVTADWEIESATPGVERWLAELPDGDLAAGRLPSSVLAVAGRALRTARFPDAGDVAVSRVMSRSGRWIVLHGTSLVSSTSRRVAVIVEPAHPGRIAPLLMAAYGLTDREQEVTRLVLQGNSTTEIADRLHVSANTVQQHLKSIFDKTGVRSRRDLVGKIFFTHYEPRLRDNEHRATTNHPLRGGPAHP
ncbi:LuxR C-terminal-related transcriptional regulator [Kribbella sp. CA-294648]|uniref:LuxR C-terminal-related transcriptional regulator n=1 Tax=Kribbella sp. CA-294648 TaxID=3239948 RepID=UPI003D8B68C6